MADDKGAVTMTFQAYLDTIKARTGKTPEDFRALAEEKGLFQESVKPGQIVAWLKADFGLGHGHAMAIVNTFKVATQPKISRDQQVAQHFRGDNAKWQKLYDELLAKVSAFGPSVAVAPTDSYISVLRKGKKFAIVQVTARRLDVGIKRKGAEPTDRFEVAGTWNSMVTHRVRISEPDQLDGEVLAWLKAAYESA